MGSKVPDPVHFCSDSGGGDSRWYSIPYHKFNVR
jgi:hypothetical protein